MQNVKHIHHAMLPLLDDTQLAYRACLPSDADEQPVPAILEFLSYLKNDGTVVRDEITMAQTAAHDDFGRQHFNSCDGDIDLAMSQWQTIHPDDPQSAESKLIFDLKMSPEKRLSHAL